MFIVKVRRAIKRDKNLTHNRLTYILYVEILFSTYIWGLLITSRGKKQKETWITKIIYSQHTTMEKGNSKYIGTIRISIPIAGKAVISSHISVNWSILLKGDHIVNIPPNINTWMWKSIWSYLFTKNVALW